MPRIAPDANDVLVLKLEETGPTFVNEGTAGTSVNWTIYGNPITQVPGLLGNAMYVPSSFISPNRDGAGGSNDTVISPNISLSGWIFQRRAVNYFAEVFNKQYFPNTWSHPFLTFGFQMRNTSDGIIELYITLNGTLQVLRNDATHPLQLGRWSHIGGTWDGTTLRMYINGVNVASTNFSGTIDYGTAGNRGRWYAGGIPGSGTAQDGPFIIQDIRVANVVRPQSYFANIYWNGFQP